MSIMWCDTPERGMTGPDSRGHIARMASRTPISKKFAPNRIKEIRQSRGLTLEQLAQLVGTNYQSIQKLENRERKLTLEWLNKLKPALQATSDEITGGDHVSVTQQPIEADDEDVTMLLVKKFVEIKGIPFDDAKMLQIRREISQFVKRLKV
jgi:transcriptional regulator with XRE-family HTH domain